GDSNGPGAGKGNPCRVSFHPVVGRFFLNLEAPMSWQKTMVGTVAALVLAPALGFLMADEAEDRAVAAIKKLGGTIKRDTGKQGKPVVQVDLENKKVTDAGLADLKAMRQLQTLRLGRTPVTDAGLAHLKGMQHLRELTLFNTEVTDAGLVHLKGMK